MRILIVDDELVSRKNCKRSWRIRAIALQPKMEKMV